MQPIERYGVIALLSLVVIISAVILWDQAEKPAETPVPPPVATGLEGLSRSSVAAADRARLEAQARPREREREAPAKPAFETKGWGAKAEAKQIQRQDKAAEQFLAQLDQVKQQPRSEPEPELSPEPKGAAGLVANLVKPKPKPAQADAHGPARTYVVRPGDTMGQIAVDQLGGYRHVSALLAANPGVDPGSMSVGTKLVLPAVSKTQPKSAQETPSKLASAPKASGSVYQVAAGDSLWKIAERELGDGMRYKEISALNPSVDPNALVLGAKLVLPGGPRSVPSLASVTQDSVAKSSPKKGVVR